MTCFMQKWISVQFSRTSDRVNQWGVSKKYGGFRAAECVCGGNRKRRNEMSLHNST